MPTVGLCKRTAVSQPSAQSNYKDPTFVTFAAAGFTEFAWQLHQWHGWHWSSEVSQDPHTGEEQVSCHDRKCKQTKTAQIVQL